MTNSCPISTPTLNEIKLVIKWACDKPISLITPAKPSPWSSPKTNTTIGLHSEIFFKKIFSIATYAMDKAIIGSTIWGEIESMFRTPKKIVIVWASVKAETWINNGLNFGENKNKPITNKMWSRPFGTIWRNPIVK